MAEITAAILVLLGGAFALIASVGLLRLPDVLTRMHASTKAGTLAGTLILIACALSFSDAGVSVRSVVAIFFLFLTAPITALFIAKWHIHRHEKPSDLPDAGEDELWATHAVEQVEDVLVDQVARSLESVR